MNEKTDKTVALAIETSGRAGSVAIGIAGDMIAETTFSTTMRHNAELFPAIKSLLDNINRIPSDIAHIYISIGPGSFTGLRIAVTMAKMAVLTNNAKVVAVNTTDALVQNIYKYEEETGETVNDAATIIDAKRGQFFTAKFKKNTTGWTRTTPDALQKPSEFINSLEKGKKPVYLLGEGLLYYKDDFKSPNTKILDDKFGSTLAKNIFLIGSGMAKQNNFTDPKNLPPLYLRGPGAVEKTKKQQPETPSQG